MTSLKAIPIICLSAIFVVTTLNHAQNRASQDIKIIPSNSMTDSIKIVLKIGSEAFAATLHNNPTSQSLIAQMPFTTEMKDYAGIEKIFYPPGKLSTKGAPAGMQPSAGDIAYYAPWGDVAVFYNDFSYSKGLIALGRIENVNTFVNSLASNQTVTFEIFN